jgi:hypothetical protein
MTSNERTARNRVRNSARLGLYADIIFADWPNWEEHMEWVATASADEIISWAKATQK